MRGNLLNQLATATFLVAGASTLFGQDCLTEQANVSSQGQQGIYATLGCMLSVDGRFVGFATESPNLVPGDTNNLYDAFVRDRRLGITERVSVSSAGGEGNGKSYGAWISDDGRYAVFCSFATNLDPADTDAFADLYVRDRQAQTTRLITKRVSGIPTSFNLDPGGISGDGRSVVFDSQDVNLVTQVDTNGTYADVFVADLQTGTIQMVSLDSGGIQATYGASTGRISADGRFVVMVSDSANWQSNLVFPVALQVFRRDRQLGTLEIASLRPDGVPGAYGCGWPSVSGDGRYVSFTSNGDDLVVGAPGNANVNDVFVRDMQTGVNELITWNKDGGAAFAGGRMGTLSRDGRFVVFDSGAWDLVVQDGNFGQEDIFVRDRQLQVTTLVSRTWKGKAVPSAYGPLLSGDGRVAGFHSSGDDIVPGNPGPSAGVFVRECADGLTSVWCGWVANSLGCKPVVTMDGVPSVSGTGAFRVDCNQLVSKTVGLFYYGTTGTQGAVFQTGFQCVKPPLARAAGVSTGGNGPPSDCSGFLSFDLDDWVAFGKDLRLTPGTTVYGQFWSRDPGAVPPTHLSSAVAFTLQP